MHTDRCCACDHRNLHVFLDFGPTPLAHRLRSADHRGPEPRFAHRLAVCHACGLVQNVTPLPGPWNADLHFPAAPDLPLTRALAVAGKLLERYEVRPGDLVVEVGSRDGTLLTAFQKYGVRTVGLEPAVCATREANRLGVETICAAMNPVTARWFVARFGPARLILAGEGLPLSSDPTGFVRGLGEMLGANGHAILTMPNLLAVYEHLHYDRLTHRTHCYLSLALLAGMLAGVGLELVDLRIKEGTSLRVVARRSGNGCSSELVGRHLTREWGLDLHRSDTWQRFGRRVAWSRGLLRAELDRLRKLGQTVAACGATRAGMALLTACRLGPDRIKYVVDSTDESVGLWTPGYPIPIVGPEMLRQAPPDVLLVLDRSGMTHDVGKLARRTTGLVPLPAPRYVPLVDLGGVRPNFQRAG